MKLLTTALALAPFFTLTFAPLAQAPIKEAGSTFKQGKFYDSTQMLDFTDSTEEEIDAYYGDIGTLTGDDLLSYLHTKISPASEEEDSKYYLQYSGGLSSANGVSRWYQITDRNWAISDEVTEETFEFVTSAKSEDADTFYLYNMYISDASNNDKTKAYSNVVNSYTKDTSTTAIDYTNYTKPNSYIQVDKEHVWAKSHGFKDTSSGSDSFVPGAPTDLHHLVAADHNTNSAGHNDHFYGVVENHSDDNKILAYLADGTTETSGWLDTSTDTFEPTDEWKGDIARCLLYMATRYSVKLDKNTQAEPYLYLTDDTTYTDDDGLLNRSDDEKLYHGVQYNLSTLLTWNESDPVSTYEIHRNNLIYKNVQNNRNPYIDHPEWARRVYDKNYSLEDSGDTSSSTSSNTGTSSGTSSDTEEGSLDFGYSIFGLDHEKSAYLTIILVAAVLLILIIVFFIVLIKVTDKKAAKKAAKDIYNVTKKATKNSRKKNNKKK